ncbi:hypothetical protein [Kitasatospora sp. NPDC098663]|uniref:hypothetical protein n=1 Tax=Kitasatospora sp. NPDC098663 TaxID=3364096 RepID=UPI0038017BBC
MTGRLSTEASSGGAVVREELILFILKLNVPRGTVKCVPSTRCWPIAELCTGTVPLFPRDLGVLMEGYVDGWIPDGPITLEA